MSFPLMPAVDPPQLPSPTVTYVTAVGSSSNTFTYTFAGTSIGTASADRLVVVCAMINARSVEPYFISSITIGGTAANIVVSSSLGRNSVIGYLLVPTGTTATVVVNLSGSGTPGRCIAGIFTVTGYTSAVPEFVGSAYNDSSVASLTIPANVSSGAGLVACCYIGNNGTSGGTWSSPLVEHYDAVTESTTFTIASAGGLPRGVTDVVITPPISIDMSMSAAAWR